MEERERERERERGGREAILEGNNLFPLKV